MGSITRSVITATLIAATVMLFSVRVLAPLPIFPPFVGPADLDTSKSLKLPSAKHLRLENSDGSVRIRTHPDPRANGVEIEARIRAYLAEGKPGPELEAYVANLVAAQSDGELLHVVTEPGERPIPFDLRVDYSVLVPQGTDVDVVGSNGNVWISEGCGRVAVMGGNADIEILDPVGMVTARNTNGRIRVVDAEKDTSLETVNGNIYAHMHGGALDANTANGHIVAWVLNQDVVSCDLNSQNGGITVVLKPDGSADVDASTERGIIRSDFDVEGFGDRKDRKHIRGVIGGGDTRLTLQTLNGNIWLAQRG